MGVLRSILAVIAGVIVVVALSMLTDLGLERTILPQMNAPNVPPLLLAIALAYRTVFGILGGWVAGRLAPSRPVTHALVLGVIGALAATAGVIAAWKLGQHWYPLTLVALAIPQSWLGGVLARRRGVRARGR